MASIKIKFRPSTIEIKEGTIFYQIIQNRVIRQLKTDYRLFMCEWNEDVLLDDIDSDLMMMYEAYLRNRGLTKNSTSFYMRILRAVYNRAVEKDLTTNRNPFKHVYTGIDKPVKRAIPFKAIKQI